MFPSYFPCFLVVFGFDSGSGLKRCGKSCRLRWLNYLRPNIKHGEFSDEEDRIICTLFATIGSRYYIYTPISTLPTFINSTKFFSFWPITSFHLGNFPKFSPWFSNVAMKSRSKEKYLGFLHFYLKRKLTYLSGVWYFWIVLVHACQV